MLVSWHVGSMQHCGTWCPFYLICQKLLCIGNFYSQDTTTEANAINSLTVSADKNDKIAQDLRWNWILWSKLYLYVFKYWINNLHIDIFRCSDMIFYRIQGKPHQWIWFSYIHSPNIAVKWLPLLHHMQEVTDSNTNPGTNYCDWVFLWFFSGFAGRYWNISLYQSVITSIKILFNLLPTDHSIIWWYIILAIKNLC
jgi:hypothetical protein